MVRRVNEEFVPVALKAGLINNPPAGIEGKLYAEISRSKPAPQGICIANSAGKALVWALSFDKPESLPEFLDYAQNRYKESPDAEKHVMTERFMRFPSQKLKDVKDTRNTITIPDQHADDDRCPAKPALERGTLVGRIIGRPLDKEGKPIPVTYRQEDYMEARFEVPVDAQKRLAQALAAAGDKRFKLPREIARLLVSHAYLGQLDVNPLGGRQTGGQVETEAIEFFGELVSDVNGKSTVVRIEGESVVAGGPSDVGKQTDGRQWEHRVQLNWEGYLELQGNRMTNLVILAEGSERLRWGNRRWNVEGEPDVAHLMAGHPIDLDCAVRYGLLAKPCADDEVAEVDAAAPRRQADQPKQADHLQRFAAVLGPRFLVFQESTWKELELNEQQMQSLTELRTQELDKLSKLIQRGSASPRPEDLREFQRESTIRLETSLSQLLSQEQLARLRPLELRLQGLFAIGQPEIARELKLSDEQRQRLAQIVQELQRQMQSIQQEARRNGDPRELANEIAKLRSLHEQQLREMLSESQLASWKQLTNQ